MRLRTFYVKSYRSIVEATLDDIQNYCVIVGPNNAGKSNLLRALFVSLSLALAGDFQRVRRDRQYSFAYSGEDYNWERDIPTSLKNNEKSATVFKLTFEFSEEEKAEFKRQFSINLSKSLQMKFRLEKKATGYDIVMPGRAKKPMEEKMREIGLFIRDKLDYQYIPCVRTSEFTLEYFTRLLDKELKHIEDEPEYRECIEKLKKLQQPVISKLEDTLTESLKTFIPNIRQVTVKDGITSFGLVRPSSYRMRQTPINIDDGNLTSIDDKGDGVKSLAAIGLVQSLSFENAGGKSLILCIEEPEAHLHPDAVHSLRSILSEIASRSGVQVIISTHSPILVDRNDVKNNVVVYDTHRVTHCESIIQVRDILGVRMTDSLSSNKIVLVEGESEKRYFKTLCSELHAGLKHKIEQGYLEFVNVHSASKMDYQIRLYNSVLISTLVILDSDDSGIDAQRQLVNSKLKPTNEVLMIKSIGMAKCELEDMVDMKQYFDLINNKFNINLNTPKFKARRKVWSDRLHEVALTSPGIFNEEIEKQIKTVIADLVCEKGMSAIAQYDQNYLKCLINAIAKFVNERAIPIEEGCS